MLYYNYNYFEKQDLDLEGEEPDIQKKTTHLLRPWFDINTRKALKSITKEVN